MQKKRFGDEQIIAILREAEKGDKLIDDVCCAHGIAENTFYRWRQKYKVWWTTSARGSTTTRSGAGKQPSQAALI
jgi:transposase-like protein